MIGKTISHYNIIEKIGEGGMGVVYKAEDTKLKRIVALKFLPSELTRDTEAKKRFIQEARAASALDHTNVCTIYEIDETNDGRTFIAMAYYEGENLKDKIQSGLLTVEKALDIIIQIARGLVKAHNKGIVHRDIKPQNILITRDGVAKILDFGLAKLTGNTQMTKAGKVVGTISYMSPEQTREEPVDCQTDIWSLGVVLYEMLTGQLPFQGEYDQAVVYSILNEEPKLPSSIRKDIPNRLQQVIMRLLEKDLEKRYENMQKVINALDKTLVLTEVMEKKEKSIIVLPFEDLSPGKDNEYFSDGLTEEIITDLSHIQELLVISRSSAMTFKGTKKTIPEIAGMVKVNYVIEGSVRKDGNNLRIAAQLIDAKTDAHLWAEKYIGTLDDVFDIQEKVAHSIVKALKLKLSPEEKKKIADHPIENIQAYECYLKANGEILKFTEESINRAIQYLQHALEIIGENSLLLSSMALAYFNMVNIGVKQEEYISKSKEFANRALLLDNDYPKAHAVLGWIYTVENMGKSFYHLKKALEVNPEEILALQILTFLYIILFGKISATVPLCEKLMRIAPLDWISNAASSSIYFYNGQFDRALKEWEKLYEMYPENVYSQFFYALILTYHNENDKAFSIIENCAKENPDNVLTKLGLMLKYAHQKDEENVSRLITPDFQKTCKRDYIYSHHIAGFFALLNQKKEALDWLENAVNHGFFNYPLLSKDPFLENIRDEPCFKKLMEIVKSEWNNFEV